MASDRDPAGGCGRLLHLGYEASHGPFEREFQGHEASRRLTCGSSETEKEPDAARCASRPEPPPVRAQYDQGSFRPETRLRLRPHWLAPWLLAACQGADAPAGPESVLLITLDTTRADVLDSGPKSRALAPRIAALADAGLRFPQAYTVAPLTLPAHASLLTGLIPPRHGLHDNGQKALDTSVETLAERLSAEGFATAAFVSSVVLDRGFGLDQGFERYDQPELDSSEHHAHAERPASATVAAATRWLAEHDGDRPFFLWVHLYDAHIPYSPSPAHLTRAGGEAYRGEVAAMDDAVGVLLDALATSRQEARTLVVLTSDHGESLGEHGEPTHGALCYESAVRVPLLFRFPGPPPAPASVRLASLVDLTPTILGRLGLAPPPDLDGFDLFAPDTPATRGVYVESLSGYFHYGWSPLVGWIDSRGKYLHSSEPEFYLPQQDPLERQDLVHSRRYEAELAYRALQALLARDAVLPSKAEDSPALDAALSALGYARGEDEAEPQLLGPSERPAPRARAQELAPLLRAHALMDAQRAGEALPLLEEIVRENPRHELALDLLAMACMQLADFARAAEVLGLRLAHSEVADARLNLGLCELELGHPEKALAELLRAEELAPDSPEIARELARARERLGR